MRTVDSELERHARRQLEAAEARLVRARDDYRRAEAKCVRLEETIADLEAEVDEWSARIDGDS